MNKRQSGFTLIEIAIVMVIIGLLLGGVLKGQEMITNARIKNVTNDFEGISAAIFSYQDRYNALPGDDPNAAARWGTGVIATMGDGIVAGLYTDNLATIETGIFWEHLHESGLITGTGLTHPAVSFGGIAGVEEIVGLGGLSVCMSGIEAQHAEIIDTQLDDGLIDSGDVQGIAGAVATALPAAGATYDVAANPTVAHVICRRL